MSIESDLSQALDNYFAEVNIAGEKMIHKLKKTFTKIKKADPKLEWIEIEVEEDETRNNQALINVIVSIVVYYNGEEIDYTECENSDIVAFGDIAENLELCFPVGTTKFD